MFSQDNDRMGYNLYSRIHVCCNNSCKAVYEEWTTEKGVPVRESNGWFNPKTAKFES